MKTVIISDVHLNHYFDEKRFLFLKELLSSCDRVILNGDFWDGYRTTFDRFIDSEWKQLFPILREKQALYLYGNHDKKRFSDERVNLFSTSQKDSHDLVYGNVTYHIEHGHLLAPSIEYIYPMSRLSLYIINNVFQRLEYVLNKIGCPHNFVLRHENMKAKKKLKEMKFPYWCLCGHTHYAEIDAKNKFANSGFIQFGKATYLIVDSSGLSLHTKKY